MPPESRPDRSEAPRRPAPFVPLIVAAGLLGMIGALAMPSVASAQSNSFTIGDVSILEGNSGAVNLNFTVTYVRRLCDSTGQITFATQAGSALASSDFVPVNGTLTFAPSPAACVSQQQVVSVPIIGDTTSEDPETVTVVLSNPVNGVISRGAGTGTIGNDDAAITVNNVSVTEGNGTGPAPMLAVFTVSLLHPIAAGRPSVSAATRNGTAIAAVDYTAIAADITFTPAISSVNVSVPITGDLLDEVNETFFLDLSGAQGAVLVSPGRGQATIIDDDASPVVSIGAARVTEGDAGTVNLTFSVSLTPLSGRVVTVDWATADDTATAGSDYTAGSGRLTFAAGARSASFTVPVQGDVFDEDDERLVVNLSNPVGATIGTGQGSGVIGNDDVAPTLTLTDANFVEGNSGMADGVFDLTLSAPSGRDILVDYDTALGTASPGADYATTSGTLFIPAGTASAQIPVTIFGDTIDEVNEFFVLQLSAPVNASIGDGDATGSITDDDPTPTVSIDDVSLSEGNTGTTVLVFTVSLSGPSATSLGVTWATSDGSATAGADYTAASGTLTFAPGVTSQTVSISVTGDLFDEPNETALVDIASASRRLTVADGQGVGTILDDDAQPSIAIDDVSVAEGSGGSTMARFTVSLSAASGRTVTVNWATADNTAVAPGDYATASGVVTFSPGATTQTIDVAVAGDVLDEATETYAVNLSAPTQATLGDGIGGGTIRDDDATPTLSVGSARITEGNSGTVDLTFTVTLSAASGRVVTVAYGTADGTAQAPADYAAASGNLSFSAGATARTITVPVNGDLFDEPDENLTVTLTAAVNATILDGSGSGVIADDDVAPSITIADVAVTEGNAGNVVATFVLSLSEASGQTITVDYASANGTAGSPADYVALAGTVTFAPGETTADLTVPVAGDTLDEPNETFFVNLGPAVNATIGDAQGRATINDNDSPPSAAISDVTVTEGNAGTTAATFTVTLSAASGRAVTVAWATGPGSALAPGDFTAASGTLTFAAGDTSETLTVLVAGDVLDEPNEIFAVDLSSATNASIGDAQGMGTITDDDAAPALSISDASVTEGNAGTTSAVFTVSLSAVSAQTITVAYATADGTAGAPADYSATSGTLSFAPGTTTLTIAVPVAGDTLDEVNESYAVNLSAPNNATIADAAGAGAIRDDDNPPTIAVDDVSGVEGSAGTTLFTFTVGLSAPSGRAITVAWATAGGTATSGTDFVAASGTLTFPAGVTTETFSVSVNGDALSEPSESFVVDLTTPTNATIADAQGAGTIVDDDAAPSLFIGNASVTEGQAGTASLTLDVQLTAASGQTVTVDFATANGSATAGADYVASSGTLTFAPGVTSRPVTVTVNADLLDEVNETVLVNLTNASNAPIIDAQGVGTINDDDAAPALAIDDVSVTEGGGVVNAIFTVTLSSASGRAIAVDFATANGAALSGADYVAQSGTLAFPAGVTSRTVTVVVSADALDEADEAFSVALSNAVNASIPDATGAGTIIDDDAAPTISIADATVAEGDAGSATLTLSLTLSAASGRVISVNAATANGTATAGSDYTASSPVITFPAGTTSRTMSVTVAGDTVDESNETLFVNLNSPVNAVVADAQALVTITDDDGGPALSIADVSVTEGNAGTSAATFTVTLSAPSGLSVSVDWATAIGTAAASDFAAASGTLVIDAGDTTATVVVSVNGDLLDEVDETFLLNLSNATNASIGDGAGTGTIADDDVAPALSIGDVRQAEGDSGTTSAVFTVTLSAASGRTVTVAYAAAGGTATLGTDFSATSGTLSFSPGARSRTFSVPVAGDVLDETDETFTVALTSPIAATLADASGQGTITDDDAEPVLNIADATISEGNTGTADATLVVSLSAPSGRAISVAYATRPGTAASDGDFTAASGTLTFAPGVTSQSALVPVIGDAIDEPDETFFVDLATPTNATVGDALGAVTIRDDDGSTVLSISNATVTEGNAGSVNATFTVTLSAASGQTVTVDYATASGTAVSGVDFTATSGTLSFVPSVTSLTVSVPVLGDGLDEANEAFTLVLSNAAHATVSDGSGAGTINDDDLPPSLAIADATTSESSAVPAAFTVTLSAPSGRAVTVAWSTLDGTALAGADYAAASGALTFAAGVTSLTVPVTLSGDALDELDETFTVVLSAPVNATLGDASGLGTVADDDAAPSLSIANASVAEGNAGTRSASFVVTLSGASGRTVTVAYATASGAALSPADFTATSGTLTFAAGVTSQTIAVPVVGDVVDEPNETFVVGLSSAVDAAVADPQATGTITDDDAAPLLSVSDASIAEGDSGASTVTFTVSLSSASGQSISVEWATSNLTALAPSDYTAASGALTFPAGTTTRTFTVSINGDGVDEAHETFAVDLTNPTLALLDDAQGIGTITDDDGAPTISIADVTLDEGDSGTTSAVFAVTLSGASQQAVRVDYATGGGTAGAGLDYTTTAGTLVFAPGQSRATISVPIAGDLLDELDETFLVTLSSPVNATLADGAATGAITDDDGAPAITIAGVSLAEGTGSTPSALFAVTLSAPSAQTVTVGFATQAGTALAGTDFTSASGTVTFAPGVTGRTITVLLAGDALDEPDETFTVVLSAPTNATIAGGTGTGTIVDDDAPPTLTVSDASTIEGQAGTTNAQFTVTLSAPSARMVSVDFASASGSATSGTDFDPVSGTLTFPPGTTSRTFTVAVRGDVVDESNEAFSVALSSPSLATIADGLGAGLIVDDDGAASLSIGDVSVSEGNSGVTTATFTVQLLPASGQTVTVQYATAAGTAISGTDFDAASGTLTFAPGATSRTFTVSVRGDGLDEAHETFLANLTSPTNAALADAQGVATIVDDDASPSVAIADAARAEGSAGTAGLTFTLTLSVASAQPITVDWATADGTAIAGADYDASSGTITFAAGATSATLAVPVRGDLLDEPNEAFTVNLTNGVQVTIADGQATGTITDDEGAPSITMADLSVAEGESGGTDATFTVTLSTASGQTITVAWATRDGTATAGSDFAAASGLVTFAPGTTTQTFAVSVLGDVTDEVDETFTVNLSSPTNATIGDASATGTITDDDAAPALTIADATVVEGDSGTTDATFRVDLARASARPVTVAWATAEDTTDPATAATAGSDFTPRSGTLSFPAGVTTLSVDVPVRGDFADEGDERFLVNLSAPTNATIGDGAAVGTITDDDSPLPEISIADAEVTEGPNGALALAFEVTLSDPSRQTITVDFAALDGTALEGLDFEGTAGTLTFPPGTTTRTITVLVHDDALDEAEESLGLRLSNPVNGALGRASAFGVIVDEDPEPTVSLADGAVTEGDSGRRPGALRLTLSAPSGRTIDVDFATEDGTALSGSDYAITSGRVTFAPGDTERVLEVEVLGDRGDEADESLTVRVVAATNAVIARGAATLTVLDDDVAPNIGLAVTTSEDFVVGGRGTFTWSVDNRGGAPTLSGVSWSDRLPAGLSFAEASGEGWTCTEGQGVVHCTNPETLEPAEALAPLLVVVDIAPEAFPSVVNTATVAVAGDLTPSDDVASIDVEVTGLADLSVTKTRSNAPVDPGTEVDWTLTVFNLGPNAVTELFVVDELPAAISEADIVVVGVSTGTSTATYDGTSGLVSGLRLGVGDSVTLTVRGLLADTATGTLENRAVVSVVDGYLDPNEVNDRAAHVSTVAPAGACDDDGLTDAEELALGTDPCNPDTDDDGLSDGDEVNADNPTDPTDADSDDDLLCDGNRKVPQVCEAGEDRNENGRVDPGEPNPNDADSDDGGVPDGEEVARGRDPTRPGDDRDGCDCRATHDADPGPAWTMLVLALGLLVARRPSRRRRST